MTVFYVLKQTECQLFLQKKGGGAYLGSAENYYSGSANMVTNVQVPMAMEGKLLYREDKKVGKTIGNKKYMAFHWLWF